MTKYSLLLQNYEKYLSAIDNLDELKLSKGVFLRIQLDYNLNVAAAIVKVECSVQSINSLTTEDSPTMGTPTLVRAVGELHAGCPLSHHSTIGPLGRCMEYYQAYRLSL